VATAAEVLAAQEAIRQVHLDDKIRQYILEIIHGTREHEDIALGGSPRASMALFRTAQAWAAMQGRDFVLPDDVKRLCQPVLGHRLILKPESRLRRQSVAAVINEVVSDVKVPILPQQTAASKDFFN
jgi:MoxR-like ATPase